MAMLPFMVLLGNAGVMKVGVRWVGETLECADNVEGV